jgi:hypothetical protein
MPRPEHLPDGLGDFVFYNGISVRADPDFHYDMDRVIRALVEKHGVRRHPWRGRILFLGAVMVVFAAVLLRGHIPGWSPWTQPGTSGSPAPQAPLKASEMPAGAGYAAAARATTAIEFTDVPPYGSFRDLRGRVLGVTPADYRVVVYIFLDTCAHGWWGPKPYFAEPPIRISSDGSWSVDITTGGCDQEATKVVAYLVHAGYEPPPLEAAASLPSELDAHAVAKREVTRVRP